ncbi:hypothetical protein Glove_117g442 [Diversispora epigaea]|uniref:FANCI helical domain-containing protein n=1 Tax=Diversispora epigaea TaxID=1348612 RepID=A0A397J354_9GLOM|nr:hypothetical protein Glove_117g442 [Diversispora epigaea]
MQQVDKNALEEVSEQLEKICAVFETENFLERELFKKFKMKQLNIEESDIMNIKSSTLTPMASNTIYETQEILLNLQDEPAKKVKENQHRGRKIYWISFMKSIATYNANKSFHNELMIDCFEKGDVYKLFYIDVEGRQTALKGYLRLLNIQISTQIVIEHVENMSIILIIIPWITGFNEYSTKSKANGFDTLYPQIQQYFVMETNVHANIKIESCLQPINGEISILEPLPYFLACIGNVT